MRAPGYWNWQNMKQRCTPGRGAKSHNYGDLGIRVCQRWLDSFDNFLADMGPRPTSRHTIERRDSAGNYEPGNCHWATRTEQNLNRRGWSGRPRGTRPIAGRFEARITVNSRTISLGRYDTLEQASEAYETARLTRIKS